VRIIPGSMGARSDIVRGKGHPDSFESCSHGAGRVMSRTLITEYAWGYHFDPGTNIVDVVINHLRKKLDARHDKKLITTVRGVGYMIRA
jgi:DNA-binding response OmpR family regulator